MGDLPLGFFDGAGVVAIAVLVAWLIMTGRLVPRRTYEDKEHEANEWRTESRIKDQQLAEQNKQLGALNEVSRTVDHILRSLPRVERP